MSWPLSQDYNEAIQSPRDSFGDAELRAGEAVSNALGIPMPRSGNFADVYEVCCPGGARWAVKCFTREVHGLRERYAEISKYLRQANLPFTVDFQYLEQGIRIAGRWYPIVKMHWIEGFTLNSFVRDMVDRPATLEKLSRVWLRLAHRMHQANITHCDLQHGNVLLVPDSNVNALAVKLIDYDGMWVPALARMPSGEFGHPAYQHPQRLREGTYNPSVDRFPLLAIHLSLRALIAGGRSLWERYDNGDNLLFRLADFEAPTKSPLFAELLRMNQSGVRDLAAKLIDAARMPLEHTPHLSELVAEEKPPASSISRSQPSKVSQPPALLPKDVNPLQDVALQEMRRDRSGALIPWIAVGSVAAFGLVGLGLLWALHRSGVSEKAPIEPALVQSKNGTSEAAPPVGVSPPPQTATPIAHGDKEDPHTLVDASNKNSSPSTRLTRPSDSPPPRIEPKQQYPPAEALPRQPEPPPIAGKPPVPDQAVLQSSTEEIQDIYKAEYASGDPVVQAALAEKLFRRGLKTFETPQRRFVLLREAGSMAAKSGDMALSFRALDELDKLFAIELLPMKATTLRQAAKSARSSTAYKGIVDSALALIVVALQADDYDTAERCIPAASQAAYRAGVPSAEVQFVASEVSRFRKSYLAVMPALATLAARPNDAEANRLVGTFLCFQKGDWKKGLPLLSRGDDAKLKELAEKDLAAPTAPNSQVEIGDGWWQLGKKPKDHAKANLVQRACYWYERALPDVTLPTRARLLKNIEAQYQTLPSLQNWDHLDTSQATVMLGFLRLYKGEKEILTRQSYSGPIEITLIARTEKNNIRLHGGKGSCVIFNWELKAEELRITRPDGGQKLESGSLATAAVTPLRPNTWYVLRWIITEGGMVIAMNGTPVYSENHKNDLSGSYPVRIRSVDSDIDVKFLRVRPLGDSRR